MMRQYRKIYLALSLSLFFVFTTSAMAQDIKAAACLINTSEGIVWVQDSLSRKLSLPGGMREANETPEQTALRETFEETGLQAKIVRPSLKIKSFQIFECNVDKVPTIGLLQGRNLGDKKHMRLNTENALHNGTEILGAWIIGLNEDDKYYRFKTQLPILRMALLKSVSPITNKPIKTPPWYTEDKQAIQYIQSFKNSFLDRVFKLFNALGTDTVFFIVLPFLFLIPGRLELALKIIYITIFSVLLNSLLKVGFALPRPLEMDPSLQHIKTAYGFGFPSGHTQVATTFWLAVAFAFARHWSWWSVLILMGIMTGFARIYFGVHFVTDVVGAWILSFLSVYIGMKIQKIRPMHWAVLGLFALAVMFYTKSIDVLAISMLGIGIVSMQFCFKDTAVRTYTFKQRALYGAIGVCLLFVLSGLLSVVKSQLGNAAAIITLSSAVYITIGCVLGILPYGIKKAFCKLEV